MAGGDEERMDLEDRPRMDGGDRPVQEVNACGPAAAPAWPVTPVIENEGSWYQFYQFAGADGTGGVYVSWSMDTRFMEPELWAFGARVWDRGHEVRGSVHAEQQAGQCVYVGHAPHGFDYFVDAGGGAWEEESQCRVLSGWEDAGRLEDRLGWFLVNATTGVVHGQYPEILNCPEDDVRHRGVSVFRDQAEGAWCIRCLAKEPREPVRD